MAKNKHGIELPTRLGVNINRAMYQGDTTYIFMLIADYLKSNNLQVPAEIVTIYKNENLCEESLH